MSLGWAGGGAYRGTAIEKKPGRRGLIEPDSSPGLSPPRTEPRRKGGPYDAPAAPVFGDQKNGMGAGTGRAMGIVRARCKIKLTNLASNLRRFVCSPFASASDIV
ncbi:MAG: hypothetical protein ACREDM_14270 [Methylocella sp.]